MTGKQAFPPSITGKGAEHTGSVLEHAFGELLAACGDLVVARSRGEPADQAGGSTRALARRYRARRRAFGRQVGGLSGSPPAGEDVHRIGVIERRPDGSPHTVVAG